MLRSSATLKPLGASASVNVAGNPSTHAANCSLFGRVRMTIVCKAKNAEPKKECSTRSVEVDAKLPLKKRKPAEGEEQAVAVAGKNQTAAPTPLGEVVLGNGIGAATKRVGEVTRPKANKNALLYVF